MKEKLRNSLFFLTLILMAGLFLGESKVYAVEVGSDTDAYDGEWGYRFLDDGTVSISEYLGEGGNITIPTECRRISSFGDWSLSPVQCECAL